MCSLYHSLFRSTTHSHTLTHTNTHTHTHKHTHSHTQTNRYDAKYFLRDDKRWCRSCFVDKYAKHTCAGCLEPLMPDVSPVQACGKLWHPEHFVCVNCDTHLGDGKVDYVEEDGDPYCAPCFETLYRTCPGCKMLISDNELNQCLKAPPVPGVWHAEHFRCAAPGCKKKLDGSYYDHEYNGVVSPFCKEHYEVLFLVPCTKCGEPITERYFENEGKAYHSHCWTCTHCDCDLKDGYVMQLGAPYVFCVRVCRV